VGGLTRIGSGDRETCGGIRTGRQTLYATLPTERKVTLVAALPRRAAVTVSV
jgi:hypothetical protein